jgi:hypothetical protein
MLAILSERTTRYDHRSLGILHLPQGSDMAFDGVHGERGICIGTVW